MPAGSKRVPMSNVDRAWFDMDSSTNLMIINGVMLFDDKLDFDLLKSTLMERFVSRYARFCQRIVKGRGGRLYWETDPHFDIRAHVRRYALPEPADISTLQTIVSAVINEPLDRRKPLWRFLLIENVEGGSAIIGRMHHCIADGIALISVLLSITADSPAGSLQLEGPAPVPHAPQASALRSLLGLTRRVVRTGYQVTRTVASETIQTLENPAHPLELARSAGIITAASAAILTKLLILPPDRRSVLKGELGAIKRVVWSERVELDRVKAIGKACGATVNDVLVAATAGALRRYMISAGDDPTRGDVNAMVPVNLRPLDKVESLGNDFALVYLSLPISLDDPVDRLMAAKRNMDVLKGSPEPFLVYQILGLIGALPSEVAKEATTWFSSKASAVLTNVPGPRQQIYLAGKPLRDIMFWVPQSGEIGLGVSIISYAGGVTLGIMVDEQLVPNPDAIMEAFQQELILMEATVKPERSPTIADDAGRRASTSAKKKAAGRTAGRSGRS